MSYRDDVDAARARSEALGRELAALEAKLGEQATLEARVREVRGAQLATARAQVDRARARGSLSQLDRVVIKTPCTQPWAEMVGDERMRFCGKCQKNVYDLSAMTKADAEAFLGAHEQLPCLRLYRRPDGTVLTSDCPDASQRRHRRGLALAGVALAATAGIAGAALALTDEEPPERDHIMGVVASPEAMERLRAMQAPVPDAPEGDGAGSGSASGSGGYDVGGVASWTTDDVDVPKPSAAPRRGSRRR